MGNPNEAPERTSLMTITIDVENGGTSNKSFKLYPGTEIVYAQGVDLAVTNALAEISRAAYGIISDSEEVPEALAVEAELGKAMQGQ